MTHVVTERETPEGLLVSVCDRDVLGETFENGQVSLSVDESFYGGDAAEAGDVVDSLSRATVANIVGTRSVELAIEHGFVDETTVLEVGGTHHAQVLRLP